ncbi:ATP-dependent endonuclease, partial [Pantoea sp. SIMBA_133]
VKKLIEKIKQKQEGSQIILTTHSTMITNKLNLKNVVWVSNGQAFSLSTLENTTAKYFQKLDNVNILKFILSEKVIIVEGASEY